MSLDYRVFDPAPCRFPRPRVSVLPRGFDLDGYRADLASNGIEAIESVERQASGDKCSLCAS